MTNSRNNIPDVMVIGGGPAGLTAFHWCKELGMRAILIEAGSEFGGQLLSIYNPITNYPGRSARNGREMRDHFLSGISGLETCAILGARVEKFDTANIAATLDTGRVITARTAIIATGVRRRKLGVPGEVEFVGRGILESGVRDKHRVAGKRVAVIGGGDAALENALILSHTADKIFVVHRRSTFRARPEFVAAASENPRIEFLNDCFVSQIDGDAAVRALHVKGVHIGDTRTVNVDAVLIRIGVEPNTELFLGQLELDVAGYVTVDSESRTSHSRIFAVGDVAYSAAPTLCTAVGTATVASKGSFALICGRTGI